jgi:hypothetical protein
MRRGSCTGSRFGRLKMPGDSLAVGFGDSNFSAEVPLNRCSLVSHLKPEKNRERIVGTLVSRPFPSLRLILQHHHIAGGRDSEHRQLLGIRGPGKAPKRF